MENHFFCGRTSFTSFRCKQNIFNETPNQRQFKVKSILWKIKYCLFEDKNIQYIILNIQFTISSHSIVAEMFRLMPFYCEHLKSPTTDTMSIIWSIVHVLLERFEAHTNTSGDVTHPCHWESNTNMIAPTFAGLLFCCWFGRTDEKAIPREMIFSSTFV